MSDTEIDIGILSLPRFDNLSWYPVEIPLHIDSSCLSSENCYKDIENKTDSDNVLSNLPFDDNANADDTSMDLSTTTSWYEEPICSWVVPVPKPRKSLRRVVSEPTREVPVFPMPRKHKKDVSIDSNLSYDEVDLSSLQFTTLNLNESELEYSLEDQNNLQDQALHHSETKVEDSSKSERLSIDIGDVYVCYSPRLEEKARDVVTQNSEDFKNHVNTEIDSLSVGSNIEYYREVDIDNPKKVLPRIQIPDPNIAEFHKICQLKNSSNVSSLLQHPDECCSKRTPATPTSLSYSANEFNPIEVNAPTDSIIVSHIDADDSTYNNNYDNVTDVEGDDNDSVIGTIGIVPVVLRRSSHISDFSPIVSDLNQSTEIPDHLKSVMRTMLDPTSDSGEYQQLCWLLDSVDDDTSDADLEVILGDISINHHYLFVRLFLYFSLICRTLYSQSQKDASINLMDYLSKLEILFEICDWQSFIECYQAVFTDDERNHILHSFCDFKEDIPMFNSSHLLGIVGFLSSILDEMKNRTVHLGLLAMETGWTLSWGPCDICCCEESLILQKNCCGKWACRRCVSEWVTEKVFSRNIEVGCLHCSEFLTQMEITHFLGSKSHRFFEIFADMNKDPFKKTCPMCNFIHELAPYSYSKSKKNRGITVTCFKCSFVWCFSCHAPAHSGLSCHQFQAGDTLVEEWGRQRIGPNLNKRARRCPRCRILIEKNDGCNHMTCNRCSMEFCFLCGKNWNSGRSIRVFGTHDKRLSIFGCKRKFMPDKPLRRKFIRGSLFGATVLGLTVGVPLAVGVGIGLLPVLLPGLGIAFCVAKKCC